ncbi:MAG: hypothetical protein HC852_21910 [Acaryochloridaceae cyanobacterium RU_4_10]|nr:hypothetical protein [Acaryochloridaceae cyanobacterium RU_4_10]
MAANAMTTLTFPLTIDFSSSTIFKLLGGGDRSPDKEVRTLPTQLSGETVLPEFTLQVDRFADE